MIHDDLICNILFCVILVSLNYSKRKGIFLPSDIHHQEQSNVLCLCPSEVIVKWLSILTWMSWQNHQPFNHWSVKVAINHSFDTSASVTWQQQADAVSWLVCASEWSWRWKCSDIENPRELEHANMFHWQDLCCSCSMMINTLISCSNCPQFAKAGSYDSVNILGYTILICYQEAWLCYILPPVGLECSASSFSNFPRWLFHRVDGTVHIWKGFLR